MNKLLPILLLSLLALVAVDARAQKVNIKSNLLYDATGTINLGLEFGLGKKTSLEISGNLNPWIYNKQTNTKLQHLLVQPEFRWWTCERFAGHFLGLHGIWGNYNVGALDLPGGLTANTLAKYRYKGDIYGAGIAYGYQWAFRKRWALEAEIGVGYAYLSYDKYGCVSCGEYLGHRNVHYFGPTKAALSLIFFIR